MSLTVWGPATNTRVLVVLAVAELAGVKVEHKVIEIKDIKDNKEFQKKNPLGQVPVLETPEGCVYQTNAIIRHIARLGNNGLYGSNNTDSSHIDQWLDFLNCDVLPAIYAISAPVLGWAPFDANVDKKGREDLNRFSDILNNQLNGGKKHFVGTTTSVADVAYAVYFSIAYRTSLDAAWRSKYANITNLVLSQFEQKALQNNFGRVNSANFPLNAIKVVPVTVAAPAAAAAAPAAAPAGASAP
jgi:elongation factor 1-gamma